MLLNRKKVKSKMLTCPHTQEGIVGACVYVACTHSLSFCSLAVLVYVLVPHGMGKKARSMRAVVVVADTAGTGAGQVVLVLTSLKSLLEVLMVFVAV